MTAYKRSPNYAWAVAFGAFCSQVLLIYAISILSINLDAISNSWQVDVGALGIMASCMGLTYGFFGFLWGSLIDKIGTRWTLTIASFLISAIVILFGVFVHDLVSGCIVMALLGICVAGLDTGVLPKIGSDWFHPSKRGIAMGFITVGGGVGGFTIGIIAGQLVADFGWEISFIGVGIVCLVLSIIVVVLVRDTPASIGTVPFGSPAGTEVLPAAAEKKAAEQDEKNFKTHITSVLKNPVTYKLGFFTIIYYCWFMTYSTFFVTTVIAAGFTVVIGGLAYSIGEVGCTLGNFIWSAVSDKLGRKPVLSFVLIMYGIMATTLQLLLWNGMFVVPTLLAFAFATGLFEASVPVMLSAVGENFKPSERGVGAGSVSTISGIGRFFGPLLAGVFITVFAVDFASMIFAGICAFICGLLALFLIKPTGGKYGDPLALEEEKETQKAPAELAAD